MSDLIRAWTDEDERPTGYLGATVQEWPSEQRGTPLEITVVLHGIFRTQTQARRRPPTPSTESDSISFYAICAQGDSGRDPGIVYWRPFSGKAGNGLSVVAFREMPLDSSNADMASFELFQRLISGTNIRTFDLLGPTISAMESYQIGGLPSFRLSLSGDFTDALDRIEELTDQAEERLGIVHLMTEALPFPLRSE